MDSPRSALGGCSRIHTLIEKTRVLTQLHPPVTANTLHHRNSPVEGRLTLNAQTGKHNQPSPPTNTLTRELREHTSQPIDLFRDCGRQAFHPVRGHPEGHRSARREGHRSEGEVHNIPAPSRPNHPTVRSLTSCRALPEVLPCCDPHRLIL